MKSMAERYPEMAARQQARTERAKAKADAVSAKRKENKAIASGSRMVCPHCQVTGQVHTEQVKVKTGVSGGKATAAVLTAGLSTLATGLSRKATVTQATCGNCKVTWQIA